MSICFGPDIRLLSRRFRLQNGAREHIKTTGMCVCVSFGLRVLISAEQEERVQDLPRTRAALQALNTQRVFLLPLSFSRTRQKVNTGNQSLCGAGGKCSHSSQRIIINPNPLCPMGFTLTEGEEAEVNR